MLCSFHQEVKNTSFQAELLVNFELSSPSGIPSFWQYIFTQQLLLCVYYII